jgi:hypothetical protein
MSASARATRIDQTDILVDEDMTVQLTVEFKKEENFVEIISGTHSTFRDSEGVASTHSHRKEEKASVVSGWEILFLVLYIFQIPQFSINGPVCFTHLRSIW